MAQNRVNRGKDFEGQIHTGFDKVRGVSIDRLPDPMAGYAGIKNICDFIVYRYPLQYYIECKSFVTLPRMKSRWNAAYA